MVSNLLPRTAVRIWEAWRDGDADRARELSAAIAPVVGACFVETNPAPVKELLSLAGLCGRDLRLPLVPVLTENRDWLRISTRSSWPPCSRTRRP